MTTHDFEMGLYHDRAAAEETIEQLHDLGYAYRDISIMMMDREKARAFAGNTDSGGLCSIIASLVTTGNVAPIVGAGGMSAPLVAGPLATALTGLAEYEEGLHRGGVLLGVNPRHEHVDRVHEIFAAARGRG